MKIHDKQTIRAHYANMRLRFKADGSVEAQQRVGGAWGILYTPTQTQQHIAALRNVAARTKKVMLAAVDSWEQHQ